MIEVRIKEVKVKEEREKEMEEKARARKMQKEMKTEKPPKRLKDQKENPNTFSIEIPLLLRPFSPLSPKNLNN